MSRGRNLGKVILDGAIEMTIILERNRHRTYGHGWYSTVYKGEIGAFTNELIGETYLWIDVQAYEVIDWGI